MLTFDADVHQYKWDGKVVPSVSEILRKVGLSKDYVGIDDFYKNRGAVLHKCVELYLKGVLDEETIDPVVKPYFDGFLAYWSKHKHKPVKIEEPLYSEDWKFAGTPDLVCENIIIDWKTSKSHDRVAELQGEGYKILVGPPIKFRVVQFPGDGSFEIFDYGDSIKYWESIHNLYLWKTKKK
jgi:hypothetical protein